MRADLVGLEERRRAEQSSRSRLENQIRELSQRQESLIQTLERLSGEKKRLENDNLELGSRSEELTGKIAELEEVVNRLAEQETKLRADLASSDELLKSLRADTQTWQERRTQFELELVKKQAELKYLDETSRKELNASLEELAAGEETVLDDDALAEAEAKYQEVRNANRRTGARQSRCAPGVSGSAATVRFPECATPGSDRFHSRHRARNTRPRCRISPAFC